MDSPKARFLRSEEQAKRWAEISHSDLFVRATDVAMLEFVHQQPRGQEDGSVLAQTFRLQGARMYREMLENLGVQPQQPEPAQRGGALNYKE